MYFSNNDDIRITRNNIVHHLHVCKRGDISFYRSELDLELEKMMG